MTFTDKRVTEFLDLLACKDPTPGGGSGAALGGALAAALVSMVCNLTIGKKGYEDVEPTMQDLLARSEALRAALPRLLEDDTQVYGRVMEAHRLPRKTDEQKAARQQAMQAALRAATEVPLAIAERCAQVVDLALPAAEHGNQWAVSDAGVAALLAEASVHAALLNVSINLSGIEDSAFLQEVRRRMETITAGRDETKARVLEVVHRKIGA